MFDGDTRNKKNLCYVEVKNVTLLGDNKTSLFPDGVSERGQKHLKELISLKKSGIRAAMLYVVSREDVNKFSPAKDIDPEYARLLKEAFDSGVEILVYQCKVDDSQVTLSHPIEFDLIN